ncbi:electron transfer flavoprotein subunit beta, partial [Halomonas heilongjiangensis]
VTTPAELGVEVASKVTLLKVEPPAERQGGVKVGSVDELVDNLKNEAKVL